MKVIPTLTVCLSILCFVDGQRYLHSEQLAAHPERKLIVGGEITPIGTKTYTTGLRSTIDSDNFCTASLIAPTYVLGASHCVAGDIRWVSIGSHYLNGTQDGEQIKVVSITNHPNYTTDGHQMSNDFVLLKLEKTSKFEPVKLAAADGSDIKAGEWATVSGWGRTDENATTSYELQHVRLQLKTNEECSKVLKSDDTVMCAGGPGNSPCAGDSGGPLVKASTNGEDVLIGLVSWGDTCGRDGTPTAFAIVYRVRAWIESIVGELS